MDANIAVTQFTAAGVAVWALQQLKNAKWFPLLKQESDRWLKIAYSIVTAIGIHTGISAVWNAAVPSSGYAYVLTFNIPTVPVMAVTVWHWLGQYVMQEAWYQTAFNKITLTSHPEGRAMPAEVTSKGQVVVPPSP